MYRLFSEATWQGHSMIKYDVLQLGPFCTVIVPIVASM